MDIDEKKRKTLEDKRFKQVGQCIDSVMDKIYDGKYTSSDIDNLRKLMDFEGKFIRFNYMKPSWK